MLWYSSESNNHSPNGFSLLNIKCTFQLYLTWQKWFRTSLAAFGFKNSDKLVCFTHRANVMFRVIYAYYCVHENPQNRATGSCLFLLSTHVWALLDMLLLLLERTNAVYLEIIKAQTSVTQLVFYTILINFSDWKADWIRNNLFSESLILCQEQL